MCVEVIACNISVVFLSHSVVFFRNQKSATACWALLESRLSKLRLNHGSVAPAANFSQYRVSGLTLKARPHQQLFEATSRTTQFPATSIHVAVEHDGVDLLLSTCCFDKLLPRCGRAFDVEPFQLSAPAPSGTLSPTSRGTRWSVQTVSDVYWKRICSLDSMHSACWR